MLDARQRMVKRQIEARGITDRGVLDAMRQVPRGAFIPSALQGLAYEDCALPIEAGQTISQPYIVAHMIAAAEIGPQSRVLEVGAGSGYAAAVISRIAARVYAIERHDVLTRLAQERLTRLGYGNVALRTGDGTRGWSEAAPFDAILVSAGGPCVPAALKDQLAVGGRLVMPIGAAAADQRLTVLVRSAEGGFRHADLGGVRFVPLVSDQG